MKQPKIKMRFANISLRAFLGQAKLPQDTETELGDRHSPCTKVLDSKFVAAFYVASTFGIQLNGRNHDAVVSAVKKSRRRRLVGDGS